MGNQNLHAAFKQYRKEGVSEDTPLLITSEILFENDKGKDLVGQFAKYFFDYMHLTSEESDNLNEKEHIAPTHFRIKESEGTDDDIKQKKALNEASALFVTGLKTAESNISDLGQPMYEKFFQTLEDIDHDDFMSKQLTKTKLLYVLYLLRRKASNQEKQSFNEYATKFLTESTGGSEADEKSKASIQAAFGFVMTLLRELKSINNGSLMNRSLEHFLETLQRTKPGSFHNGDKHSFALDASLNTVRAFLVELINGNEDKKVVTLAFKLIFMLGLARSSVEDFLVLVSLLSDKKHMDVDLRDELKILRVLESKELSTVSKEDKFDAGAVTYLGQRPTDLPICVLAGESPSEIIYLSSSKKEDSWVQDGTYLYALVSGMGLVKISMGVKDSMPGRIIAINKELDKQGTIMLFEGKIYMRSSDYKPAPFVTIECETLQEVKIKPELKFDEQSKDKPTIQWLDANEETGRSLGFSPMFSDGTFIYVIAIQKDKKDAANSDESSTKPKLVVECYDPSKNYEFVKATTLSKNTHLEPFVLGENTEDDLKKAQWATNGSILVCFPVDKPKARFFSLETGIKVSSKKGLKEGAIVTYDAKRHQFIEFITESMKSESGQVMKFQALEFGNFKRPTGGKSSESSKLDVLQDKLIPEDKNEQDSSSQQFNLLDQLMHSSQQSQKGGASSKTQPVPKDIPREQVPELTKALILRYLSKRCLNFETQLEVASKSTDVSGAIMMSIFRYPLVTYLSDSTFNEFGRCLGEYSNILQKGKDKVESHQLYSMLYLLQLVSANFKALNYCSINLTSLLTRDSDHKSFMKAFQGCVGQLSALMEKEEKPKQADLEIYDLWQSVIKVSQDIKASSIKLLHNGPAEILETIISSLKAGDGSKCTVQISHLSQIQQLRQLIQGTSSDKDQLSDKLMEVFQGIAKLDGEILKSQLKECESALKQPEEPATSKYDSDFIGACQQFILNFSEEISSQYLSLLELKKPDSVTSPQALEVNQELLKYKKLICLVAETCFTELNSGYKSLLESLSDFCDKKPEDSEWEQVPENFKKFSSSSCNVLVAHQALQRVVMLYTQVFSLQKPLEQTIITTISKESCKLITSLSILYTVWKKYREKLGLPEDFQSESSLVDDTLQKVVEKLRRHLNWYIGLISYQHIKIDVVEDNFKKDDAEGDKDSEKNKESKEKKLKQQIKMVISSNLLSGGIETKHLKDFSKEARDQLIGYAESMDDENFKQALTAVEEKSRGTSKLSEIVNASKDPLYAVIFPGKDDDTDLTIQCLQFILERKIPMVPFARIGGADGLKMSRAAFAVMIKFSDLLEDFLVLVDTVSMQAPEEEEGPGKIKALADLIKSQPQGDIIIRRWESASRMRQWINEKKQSLVLKLEKTVKQEVLKEKEKVKEEEAKKAEEATEGEEPKSTSEEQPGDQSAKKEEEQQIDSSSKPEAPAADSEKKDEGAEPEKKDDEEDKEVQLTPDELTYISDEAFKRLEAKLSDIFVKITDKSQFMIKLNIPSRFRKREPTKEGGNLLLIKAPTSFMDGIPKPKLDWEGRLKAWKQSQTSKGAIKSLTDRTAEIWNSGIISILALLQTPIESGEIQKQVEKIYVNSCKRAVGLRFIRELIKLEMPQQQFYDILNWFCSALRRNQNKLCHYLDDTKGQGLYLENQSKKSFFAILGVLVNRLKDSKDETEIRTILNSLKWKFTARDHANLLHLNIFSVLHKGNGEKDSKLKKAWGRNVLPKVEANDSQKISDAVLEMFEQLFLTVAGRIVEPDFGGDLQLQKPAGSGTAPQLQKAKSVIDENVSEQLLTQAFDSIFKELRRYIIMMSGFQGVNWSVYVQLRNQERKDGDTPKVLQNEDDVLLDEIEEEQEEKEDKEEEAEKSSQQETQPGTETKQAGETEEEPKDEEAGSPKEEDKKSEKAEKAEKEEQSSEKDKQSDNEEDEQKTKADDEEQQQKEQIATWSKERQDHEFKQLSQLYSESFLKRLLRLVEIFTSIATTSSHPLSMVQRVANPYHLSSLLNLLIISSPTVKIVVLKIIQHIVMISIPFEVFEEAVRVLTRDEGSLAYRILHKEQSQPRFESSMFIKFLFNYLLSTRSTMWKTNEVQSEGQYAVSKTVSATLRVVRSQLCKCCVWSELLTEEIKKSLLNIENLPLDEADAIFSLLPGGEYGGLTSGDQALTNKNEIVTLIGYSSQWEPIEVLCRKDSDELEKLLKKLRISAEFTDKKQKAIALFYDKSQKQRQDMMILHPSSLSAVSSQDDEEALQHANISPLMDPPVIKYLVGILQTKLDETHPSFASKHAALQLKQSQILKILCNQIEVVGQKFIEFLQEEEVLQDLMTYLYRDIESLGKKAQSDQHQVIQLKWLENKLQNMRKLAIETNRSLSVEAIETKAFVFNQKELIFKRTDPQAKIVTRTNAYLTSAINIHKVNKSTRYSCYSSKEISGDIGKIVKNGLVMMQSQELKDLSERALQIINSSDAIMTIQEPDFDVKALFKKLVEVYKEDQEQENKSKCKYENILQTVIFFVNQDDFDRCSKPLEVHVKKPNGSSPLENLLEDLNEWGGLDRDQVLHILRKDKNQSPSDVLSQLEEGLAQAQANEQKYQDKLKMYQKVNDLDSIKKLEAEEEENKVKRNSLLLEKKELLLAKSESLKHEEDAPSEKEIPVFEEFSKDSTWWQELQTIVKQKMSVKKAISPQENSDEEKKNEEAMTKLLHDISNDFDPEKLQFDHANVIDYMISLQRKECFLSIIKCGKQEELLPSLLISYESQANFSKFLRIQFNSSVMQMIQIGQKKDFKLIKQKIKDIFSFCSNTPGSVDFIKRFFLNDILRAGVKSIVDFKELKTKKIQDYFVYEERAVNGLNPYLLKFVTAYLIKTNSLLLTETKNAVANLFNVHLLMVFSFQDSHKFLVKKLLKSCLKLLHFAMKNCGKLAKDGELAPIIQNKLVNMITKEIDYTYSEDQNSQLNDLQLLLLEIHFMIDSLAEECSKVHNIHIGKILEDTKAISLIKRNKRILQEAEHLNLIKYLYHLEHLEEDQRALMNVNVETSHPAFDTMTRAFIQIPDVQRITIKFKDTMKLKDLTYVGISNDPNKQITLKSINDKEKEFEWSAGSFYLFYPVQTQSIVGFGKNSNNRLGESPDQFKVPSISTIEDQDFRPVKLYGDDTFSVAVSHQGELFETGGVEGDHTQSSNTSLGKFHKNKTLKGKVRQVAVAQKSLVVLLEDNTVWYRGTSQEFHFPNNESKSAYTKLTIWAEKDLEEKIVDMASGTGFTIFVTENGKVRACGQRFLTAIGQSSQEVAEVKLPKGHLCRKVWASRGAEEICAFLELEDTETKVRSIFSAGKSTKGLLGQGQGITESKKFKKLAYESNDLVFESLSVGHESAIAIDTKGKLWGWGYNLEHCLGLTDVVEGGIPKPFGLYPLNNLGLCARRVSCGKSHSLILFEGNKGKQTLYSVGLTVNADYCHLGVNEDDSQDAEAPFREIKTFSDRKLLDFLAHDLASLVILEGGETVVDNLYSHRLSDGRKARGLLHFFKEKEAWKFISESEYESRKGELPDLCFAIKCPIEDLETLNWPDLDALAAEIFDSSSQDSREVLCTQTGKKIEGPLYYSRCLINHEEIEVNYSEQTVFKDDQYSINPLIFIRASKPLKKEAKLPSFALENFYKQDSRHGIDLEIIPDLTHQKNEGLIKSTQDLWDEIADQDSKFNQDFTKDLLRAVDAKISGLSLARSDTKAFEKDVKMSELEFKDKGLKKLSDKTKKQKAVLYWMLNSYFFDLLPYSTKCLRGIPNSVIELIQSTKSCLFTSMKNKCIQTQIDSLPTGSSGDVTIKRGAALRFRDEGKCDHTGEFTIFGQIFQQYKRRSDFKDHFKRNDVDAQAWSCRFAGEGSIDAGGPFRECLTNMIEELESDSLPLLIKTVNNRNDHGLDRDCYTLNPASTTPTHKELFIFMGYFLGFSIRAKSPLNWHFPAYFWKQILGEELKFADLEGYDAYSYQVLRDIKKYGQELSAGAFEAAVDEKFETYLSNGKCVEICPGGSDIAVTHANHQEYVDLVIKARINECQKQMEWVKEGVDYIIPLQILDFLTWEEVELRAVGPKEIEASALKACSEYNVGEDHKIIKWFWAMFETFTQEERRKYLKFVWGRSKLPVETTTLDYKHQVHYYEDKAVDSFPESHTCFFTVDLGPFKSLETMSARFRTAIELCGEIDGDHDPEQIADEDGNYGEGDRGGGGGGYEEEE